MTETKGWVIVLIVAMAIVLALVWTQRTGVPAPLPQPRLTSTTTTTQLTGPPTQEATLRFVPFEVNPQVRVGVCAVSQPCGRLVP